MHYQPSGVHSPAIANGFDLIITTKLCGFLYVMFGLYNSITSVYYLRQRMLVFFCLEAQQSEKKECQFVLKEILSSFYNRVRFFFLFDPRTNFSWHTCKPLEVLGMADCSVSLSNHIYLFFSSNKLMYLIRYEFTYLF